MAELALPDGDLKAGADYCAALNRLGFSLDSLLWAFDELSGEFALVLITQHVDHAGPLALFELLVKAYNSSATPKEISPFDVRVFSPAQPIVDELRNACRQDRDMGEASGEDVPYRISSGERILTFRPTWLYYLHPVELEPTDRTRDWDRFRSKVEKLAA